MRGVLGSLGSRVAQGVGVAKNVAQGVARGAFINDAKAALTAAATTDDEAEVELQLQRVADALMPEYRREAIGQLKDLLVDNPKAQLAVGNEGIPVLLTVLEDDRDDLELVRGALECLVCAMTTYHSPDATANGGFGTAQAAGQEAQAGAINAELFARKPEHVQLLLNLLEEEPVGINDFYVRYHTVQLLTLLLQACSFKLQDVIVSSPMAVVRLCELLGEREVIRNEALQLLVALTRSNEEVQKIAAFEGAFDRVFSIVKEEGGSDGPVVVQDCLELLNNLLRSNQANQRLFREMGFVPQLVQVLSSAVPAAPASEGGSPPAAANMPSAAAALSAAVANGLQQIQGREQVSVSKQKAAILLCALESLMLLVGPSAVNPNTNGGAVANSTTDGSAGGAGGPHGTTSSNTEAAAKAACHAALLQAGVVEALLPLCLHQGGVTSTAVRVQALRALADVITGHPPSREKMASSSVLAPTPSSGTTQSTTAPIPAITQLARSVTAGSANLSPVPVLPAVLRVALHAADAQERAAAGQLLRAYCLDNPEGQMSLACSISPSSTMSVSAGAAPGSPAATSFGSELATALAVSAGPGALQITCRAAVILQHLLEGNHNVAQRLLSLPLEVAPTPGAPTELLLPRCMKHVMAALRLGGREGQSAATLLLRLLCAWLHGCPPAVKALLDVAAHLPLLVDLVLGRHPESCPEVSGLAALLLGECLIYSSNSGLPTQPPPSQQTHNLVLDVLLSRIGLSQYLSRLDELMACPSFVVASQPPKLPQAVTRASAAAATAGDAEEIPLGNSADVAVPLQRRSVDGHATTSGGGSEEVQLFDYPFTQLAREVQAAVKDAVMVAFSKPAGASGTTPPKGTPEQMVAALPGATETAKLLAAVDVLRRLDSDLNEVRARNRALAEDLFRVSAGGQPTSTVAPNSGGGGGAPPHSHSQPTLAAPSAPTSSPADLEARIALEMRASKAEMEAAALKQQLDMISVRLQQAEKDAAAAREAAAQAHSVATKYETDLQDLSAAYNSLEGQAFQLESQVRELTAKLAAQSGSGAGGLTEQQVQARVQAAVEAERLAAQKELAALRSQLTPGTAAGSGAVPESEVAQRIAAAVEKAKEEAEAEGEEQMTDLLVCLGQEEQKVALLREKLEGYGVDVESLLATIQPDEPEGEEDEEDLR